MATAETKSSAALPNSAMNGVGPLPDANGVCLTPWTVQLNRDQHWLKIIVGLVEPQFGDNWFLRFAPSFQNEINGVDDESSEFTLENWLAGVRSGLQYGFRSQRLPLQPVIIYQLAGKLDADGIDALAHAAALAITSLMHRQLPEVAPVGWTVTDSQTLATTESASTN